MPPAPRFVLPDKFFLIFAGVRSRSWCYDHYQNCRAFYKLRKDQFPTIRQVAEFVNLDEDEVRDAVGYGPRTSATAQQQKTPLACGV